MTAAVATVPLCVLCDRRPADRASLACRSCPRRLADDVDELYEAVARLDPAPATGGPQGGSRPPGFESRSPANDTVLSLTDVRGWIDPDQPGALVGVPVVLRSWRERMHEAGYGSGLHRDAVEELARGWWEAPDFARAIRSSLAHVRRALGEVDPTIPIGTCPRLPAEHLEPEDLELLPAAAYRRPCGGEIRARSYGQTAQCRGNCGTTWRGEVELRALGERLGDAWMDLPALARYLDVKPGTLRQWARRDGWGREAGAHLTRTLYRLQDARASWWRAYDRANPLVGPWRGEWEELENGVHGPHRDEWERQDPRRSARIDDQP